MSKKKKDKDTSRLRAQVEFLKAQLKSRPAATSWREEVFATPASKETTLGEANGATIYHPEPALLRRDLRKTFFLTFLAGILLIGAYLTQNYWSLIGPRVWQILKRG